MPKGKVNKALQVLIDEGYLSVSKAKKIVLSYEEAQMSFIPKKSFNAITDMVLFNLWQKKGILKRTAKSIHHLLQKDNKDIDMLEVMAEIYKSSNNNMVEREKQEVDGRKGVFVYRLTDKGRDYVRSIL